MSVIVPEKVDSFLTRYASRSYYDDLLDIGVDIHLYLGGLLHTKSITVDGTLSMFGTANLDMRSLEPRASRRASVCPNESSGSCSWVRVPSSQS